MTWHEIVQIAGAVSGWLGFIYIWARILLGRGGVPAICKELFPIMHYWGWPMNSLWCLHDAIWEAEGFMRGLNILFFFAYLGIWWIYRHDGDDRWKKRRKKALAKVKQVGRKLVIVPIPQPLPIKN